MRSAHHGSVRTTGGTMFLLTGLLSMCLISSQRLNADTGVADIIELRLGDYRFSPQEIRLEAGKPAVIRLVNTDAMTPHNFTLAVADSNVAIDVDIIAGDSIDVELKPLPAGRYAFHCNKKLPFMKSHREKGMEGTLIVTE